MITTNANKEVYRTAPYEIGEFNVCDASELASKVTKVGFTNTIIYVTHSLLWNLSPLIVTGPCLLKYSKCGAETDLRGNCEVTINSIATVVLILFLAIPDGTSDTMANIERAPKRFSCTYTYNDGSLLKSCSVEIPSNDALRCNLPGDVTFTKAGGTSYQLYKSLALKLEKLFQICSTSADRERLMEFDYHYDMWSTESPITKSDNLITFSGLSVLDYPVVSDGISICNSMLTILNL